MDYKDDNNDGIVDGTNPGVKVSTLGIWWLDEGVKAWVRLPSSIVDTSSKKVTATTPHWTTFALIGQSDTALSNAHAYPVPFRPDLGHNIITFTGLAQQTKIKIFTVNGELVKELIESDGDGKLEWNVRNSAGQSIRSGVYFYILQSETDKKRGEIVIIR